MITIARDPVELLTSEISMRSFYDKSIIDKIENTNWTKNVIEDFNTYLSGIDNMTLIDRFSVVIDYKDLVAFPFETTKSVCNIIGLEIINEQYVDNLKDYTEHNHILSSKKVKEYDQIGKHVSSLDLTQMYRFYDALIAKRLEIPGILK
jgi:hypothetical protein